MTVQDARAALHEYLGWFLGLALMAVGVRYILDRAAARGDMGAEWEALALAANVMGMALKVIVTVLTYRTTRYFGASIAEALGWAIAAFFLYGAGITGVLWRYATLVKALRRLGLIERPGVDANLPGPFFRRWRAAAGGVLMMAAWHYARMTPEDLMATPGTTDQVILWTLSSAAIIAAVYIGARSLFWEQRWWPPLLTILFGVEVLADGPWPHWEISLGFFGLIVLIADMLKVGYPKPMSSPR